MYPLDFDRNEVPLHEDRGSNQIAGTGSGKRDPLASLVDACE
jgi:hypothetical protein